jgi:GNAT superfamily N-acetyltransferase
LRGDIVFSACHTFRRLGHRNQGKHYTGKLVQAALTEGQSVTQIRIKEVSANAPPAGFWELLALSVGSATIEKLERVKVSYTEPDRTLAAGFANGRLAGVIGYRRRDTELEITHIAVREDFRHQGVARALIYAISRPCADLELVAETDDETVGFYRAIGFRAEALPREIGCAQRWRCRLLLTTRDDRTSGGIRPC